MFFVVAPPTAPLPPTAVRCWCNTPLTPPLSLGARCALRERTGLTHAAPPALGSGRGWCSVAPGCIFERGIEARRSLGIGVIIPLRLLSHLCALCGGNLLFRCAQPVSACPGVPWWGDAVDDGDHRRFWP